jgi:hypothetical protein
VVVSPFLPYRSVTADTMAPTFAYRFLIYRCTDYVISTYSLARACSYHFDLGPDYLWVAHSRSVFRSALGVLFPQYPLYLESVPRSATWGVARWRITNSPIWVNCFNKNELYDISVDYLTVLLHIGRSCVPVSVQRPTVFKVFVVFGCSSKLSFPSTSFQLIIMDNAQSKLYDLHQGWPTSLSVVPVYITPSHTYQTVLVLYIRITVHRNRFLYK